MKKILAVIAAMSILLTSCGNSDSDNNNSENKENSANKYVNGTYTAKCEGYTNGWQEFLTLEIKDDVVTIIQYDAVNENGDFMSSSTEADNKYMENNRSFSLPEITNKEKFDKISESFVNADKNTSAMECVAGATRSTDRFRKLADAILKGNALTGSTDIVYVKGLTDGVYTVEEAFFNSGWKDFVEVTVTDGEARVTRYDSYNKDGELKSEDENTKTRMISYTKNRQSGEMYPEKYIEELTERFNASGNNPSEIETVAGATISSEIFIELAEKALYNSSINGKHIDFISKYTDGTYHAEMSVFTDGWKDYVDLEIKDDVIYIKDFNSVDVMGKKKTDDAELKEAMKNGNVINGLPETCPDIYVGDIVSAFTRSGSDVIYMDNVAGATRSTNNFKLMVGEILRRCALDGKPKSIVVEPYVK